ncbi:metallophosphoesterase [Elusimicrobiota bacterium]
MIGLIADTHDNLPVISRAVEVFNERNVTLVLHAGDFVSPFTVRAFGNLQAPMKGVFGNNDGDPVTLINFFKGIASIEPNWIRIEHDNKIIYLTHRPLACVPDECNLYVYGHTHEPSIVEGRYITVNPGECSGWLSNKPTIALVDLQTNQAELIEL